MVQKKEDPEAKFHGRFLFNLCSVKVRKDCYGKAAMIISTLLGLDHRSAEQIVADSGRASLNLNVADLRKLQLVKICLNKAGVFIAGDELDTTHYLKKNESSAVPDLVRNDNVAQEAYYEAYKAFRSTYAELFHIDVPQVNDLEEEDRVEIVKSDENREQQQETVNEDIDRFLSFIRNELESPSRGTTIDRARYLYQFFRKEVVLAGLHETDPNDEVFRDLIWRFDGKCTSQVQ